MVSLVIVAANESTQDQDVRVYGVVRRWGLASYVLWLFSAGCASPPDEGLLTLYRQPRAIILAHTASRQNRNEIISTRTFFNASSVYLCQPGVHDMSHDVIRINTGLSYLKQIECWTCRPSDLWVHPFPLFLFTWDPCIYASYLHGMGQLDVSQTIRNLLAHYGVWFNTSEDHIS